MNNDAHKKRGRPKKAAPLTVAQRQAKTRSNAIASLMAADIDAQNLAAKMSTSNLISSLPRLMKEKQAILVSIVCEELVKRVAHL